jgi:hypothetical protein
MAHPHLASPIPQMLTTAQGHQDQRRRRARVQKVSTPFGRCDRGSTAGRRYPRRVRRGGHARGRLLARGPTRPLSVWVVVVMYVTNCSRGESEDCTDEALHEWIRGYGRGRRASRRRLVPSLLYSQQLRSSGALPGDTHPSPRTGGRASRIVLFVRALNYASGAEIVLS